MNQSSAFHANRQQADRALTQAREVPLGYADLSQDTPLHTCVGASVAICMIDQRTSWCALRQVMMPPSARGHRQDAMLKADAALEEIFAQLCAVAEIDPGDPGHKRIEAKIFGGAEFKSAGQSYSDGAQSVSFVRAWLNTRHIPIAAESLLGIRRRQIVVVPRERIIYCRTHPIDEDFLSEERSKLSAVGELANKIELF